MNATLLQKILAKLSLKDLYDEIKDNDQLVFSLGILFVSKKKSLFCAMIRDVIQNTIKTGSSDLADFFKTEIVNMDGSEEISINDVSKKKVTTSSESQIPTAADPCGAPRGSVHRSC